jgi:hypothetical protein
MSDNSIVHGLIDDKFPSIRPTLASDINVANGISDKAKAALLLNLLMHLA